MNTRSREAISSNGRGAFGANRDADLNEVSVGDERYEIPDIVVWGD